MNDLPVGYKLHPDFPYRVWGFTVGLPVITSFLKELYNGKEIFAFLPVYFTLVYGCLFSLFGLALYIPICRYLAKSEIKLVTAKIRVIIAGTSLAGATLVFISYQVWWYSWQLAFNDMAIYGGSVALGVMLFPLRVSKEKPDLES